MIRMAWILGTVLLLTGGSVAAQTAAPQPHKNPLGDFFFPPELIMRHQRTLALTEEQKKSIKEKIQQAQTQSIPLQWDLQSEMETMKSLVKGAHVGEEQVLAQLEKLLDLERKIKRIHLTLAVGIKNSLTPQQQRQLQELKHKTGPR